MPTKFFPAVLLSFALPGVLLAGGGDPAAAKAMAFFETKIRPVLSKHCYECHSAQGRKVKAGLLLDSKAGMLEGGDSGPVLVPGKSRDSLIIKALRHEGPKMPSTQLPDEIIADFVRWIDMGAPDPRIGKATARRTISIDEGRKFWAFQPLAAAAPPKVKNNAWVRTPVDRFILARLEEKRLTPNSPAARERLIRRAFFDLHGLPPTPADFDAFVADSSPDAFEKLIDRLLQGQHFGERWARHWLDTVRFAESGGYEFDKARPTAYHYRDFVIKAFNDDMPFDRFVRWQIAGDHLAPGNLQAIAATGFLVAGSFPGQTTAKTAALIRYDHLDDMISTLGTSMLGLSLGCARCHEHKYDPIPQEDYYRMIAALARTDSANVKVNTEPDSYRKAREAYDEAHAPFLKARDEFEKELPGFLQTFWNTHKDQSAPAWLIVAPVSVKSKSKGQINVDGSYSITSLSQKNDTFVFTVQTLQRKIKALRLEAMAGQEGEFVLSDVNVAAAPLNPAMKPKVKQLTVKLKAGQVSAQTAKHPLSAAVDGNPRTGWSPGNAIGEDHAAIFEFDGDVGFEAGTILTVTLKFDNDSYPITRPRLSFTTQADVKLDADGELQTTTELLTVLRPLAGKWKADKREAIVPWLRKLNPDADRIYQAIERHALAEPKANLMEVFAAQSGRGGEVHFLVRGEVEKKKEVARAGFVQVLMNHGQREQHWLPAKSTEPRTALANWITDADSGAGHLLARVIVNRLWQHLMGRGLVATPNDFGAQGEPPSHPELLDYLAGELIKNGWKLKPVVKLIMTSSVYMQGNAIREANLKIDPQNRLWWRHPTRRLEAEAIRDSILAVGGTLDTRMYGPGSLDGGNARRSVYLTVKRSQMIPLLQMFDVPEALQSIGERSVTTVPTQSLAFMNSPFVRTAAQKLAVRIRPKTADALGQAVEDGYLIALSRRPSAAERQRMESFIARQTESYGKAPQARDLALTDFCQVLLCLNEFIYVD